MLPITNVTIKIKKWTITSGKKDYTNVLAIDAKAYMYPPKGGSSYEALMEFEGIIEPYKLVTECEISVDNLVEVYNCKRKVYKSDVRYDGRNKFYECIIGRYDGN